MKTRKALFLIPYLMWIILFVILPILLILWYSFTDSNRSFTLNNYAAFFRNSTFLRMMLNSFWYALLITLITLLISYPAAYFLTKMKNQQLWLLLIILPTWINLLLKAYAFIGILGNNGLVNKFLQLFGIGPVNILFTDFAFIFVATYIEIPFMIFASRIIRRYGSKKVLSCCTFAISVRLLVYIIFPSFWGALAGQLLNSLTFGLLHPAAISFICEHVKGKKQVTALAMYTVGANGIGNIIGSAVGGLVIAKYGFPVLFIAAASLPPLGILLFHFMLKKTSD